MRDEDNEGRKPYKTYKAGRARRTPLDDELAGARAPGRSQARRDETPGRPEDATAGPGAAAVVQGSARDYQRYSGGSSGGRAATSSAEGAAGRRRRLRWWHVPVGLLVAAVVAGVVLTVLAWPGYNRFDRSVDKANGRIDDETRAQLAPDDGWIWRKGTTLLLLGVDSKAGEPARSDTILLMRFNPGTHTVNQLSIPRDTRVQLPNGSVDKINAAMFWGGPAMAVQTVQDFTGIPVNHVMVVDFKGFPRLVNAVGGVDMRVPETVTTVAGANGRTVVFKKGMHHFDGKYAMLYVRIRYADDDFHRATRQQAFVQALQKKVVQPSNITRLPQIGTKFMSGVATDLTTNQLLEIAYLKWRSDGGRRMVMGGTPGWEGGVAYVLPPSEADKQKLVRRFLDR